MKLTDLQSDEIGVIAKIDGNASIKRRMAEMGFVKGKEISVVKHAPLKDPIEFNIMGYEVSLRRAEADLIEVFQKNGQSSHEAVFNGIIHDEHRIVKPKNGKQISVAFVGNPNSGKTTLFNEASGARERVGNYSGVTVSTKKASMKQNGYRFDITDLPGTYSISAHTPEESFVRKTIFDERPDVIVNIVDASNLERNLLLTTQLLDMGFQVVIALNMFDELEKKGDNFDYKALGKMIGVPIIPTIGLTSKGVKELFEEIIHVFEGESAIVRPVKINYGNDVESSIQKLESIVLSDQSLVNEDIYERYLAIKLLEQDPVVEEKVSQFKVGKSLMDVANQERQRLQEIYEEDGLTILNDARYGFISGALKETFRPGKIDRFQKSKEIDGVLTNKYLGLPLFVLFMWITFQATFFLGEFPMNLIEDGVSFLGSFVENMLAPGPFRSLVVDGIIAGVGSVIVFLPNILILFFFISLMEDTGYMARAAFITDKLMHRIGLHGKSIIPLIMGFGCNVPAVMATRTLEDKNDRLLTMLINPFMSCSARLSVYILIIGAFFPQNPGSVLFAIYFIGVLLGIAMAILFKKTLFKEKNAPFVMELPPYRIPTLKTTTRHMWFKGSQYIKKMGGMIMVASIIIWALGYFPRHAEGTEDIDNRIATLEAGINSQDELLQNEELEGLYLQKDRIIQENSYIGRMGKFIEPVIRPLGFDWKMGVSLITGMAAKEIVVSTMGVLYQVERDADENSNGLMQKLRNYRHESGPQKGELVFSPLVAFSFMLFILIYFPCVAVIAGIKNESNSWKWATFTMLYTTVLAWLVSFVFYQGGQLLL